MKHTHVSISTYATEDCLRKVINEKSEHIRFAECALHDKDLKEDGTPKEPHHHVNIWLVNPRESDDIAKWFKKCVDSKGEICNTRAKETYSATSAHDYLTHSGDSEGESNKYQYDKQIIKILRGELSEYLSSKTDTELRREKIAEREERAEAKADDLEQQLTDIIDGKPLRYMARQYGRDYIKNRKAYHEYAAMMVVEEDGDLDKADKILGIGFDQLRYEAHKEGYTEGVRESFRTVTRIVEKRVAEGNTFDKDLLAILAEITKNI